MDLDQVTLPALDIEVSTAFYCAMGFEQVVCAPRFARFACPAGDATFSLHLTDDALASGVVTHFECAALDEQVAALREGGFNFDKLPADERWLWREARLRDPAGNVLCLYWAGENRKDPPWRLHKAE